ncbi:amidohydrolase [Sphingomonas jatrophae]|uniref:Hippurate hydrolase n=1 Tax=Sphingomonas jatrophae TaxID=1166337 RepID=A0A1I6K3D0_9SPHN|nr:amidohydrolase [Sphingomonas jatrophae]SFR85674.1 hippurate hydrolase [Sphingomonas jatrophae]
MQRLPFLALVAGLMAAPVAADPLTQAVAADMPGLMGIYRTLHANPELSFEEHKSAATLAAEARKLGFEMTEGVGGTGVVAVMRNGPGPTVLLRADMDALPVEEQTGLPFASKAVGKTREGQPTPVMHACGHDTHMTAWIGTARRLAAMKDRWSGTLVMIGQPAEEIVGGAAAMLKDGLYTRFPKPEAVIAFHDSAALPAGVIGYNSGPAMASSDSVDIVVKGRGGHGAMPQTTVDPIVIAARIVTTLQTLVSREVDPHEVAIVTVGSFHAGTKHNIVPAEAKLQLTVRAFDPGVRRHLLDGIRRIAKAEAEAAGLPAALLPTVTLNGRGADVTVNSEPLTGQVIGALTQRFGAERVRQTPSVTASEDFSQYALADPKVQSLLFWVGGVPQAKWDAVKGDPTQLPSLHSPFWAPDAERVISTAVEAMTTAALSVIGRK